METRDVTELGSGPAEAESPPPPGLWRDLKHIVLQHLRAEGYKEAAHSLEGETGLYLNAEHVADLARRGAWDEAERYLGAFVNGVGEDLCSARIFFALRRRKYIEALDRRVTSEEGAVLVNDLKVLAPYDEEVAKMVAALENFRQRECLDTASARDAVALEIKKLIQANPLFQDKLEFPSFEDSRLRMLVNQSLSMQHFLCKKQQNPEVDTLFIDHSCDSEIILCTEPEPQNAKKITKSARKAQQITKLALKPQEIAKPAEIMPPAACARATAQFAGCMTNATPSLPHGVVAKEAPSLVQPPNTAELLKHPTIPTGAPGIDYPMKRICLGQPDKEAINACRTLHVKPKDKSEKITTWMSSGGFLQLKHLPDEAATYRKVVSLLYTDGGMSLLALGSNGIFKLWKWEHSDTNHNGKLWHPANGIVMKNDTSHGNPEEATACIALSYDEFFVVSASGGKVYMFDLVTFRRCTLIMAPPPAATFIVFHPEDKNIIALGMDDSTIQIYNVLIREVTNKLEGHHKKITGLSFYPLRNVLVSSGADAQLCVWSTGDWKKKGSRYMIQHSNHFGALDGDTRVQFDDCGHLLVVNESQLAIYDWKLKCSSLWSPGNELRSRISSAVFSCDGLLVYAGFCDGTIKIFQADFNEVFCNIQIQPSGHVQGPLSSVGSVYPMVIAAHPSEPNQIAVGLSDGAVIVLGLPTWTIIWQQCLPRTM